MYDGPLSMNTHLYLSSPIKPSNPHPTGVKGSVFFTVKDF